MLICGFEVEVIPGIVMPDLLLVIGRAPERSVSLARYLSLASGIIDLRRSRGIGY
jgi:hypothetical protein